MTPSGTSWSVALRLIPPPFLTRILARLGCCDTQTTSDSDQKCGLGPPTNAGLCQFQADYKSKRIVGSVYGIVCKHNHNISMFFPLRLETRLLNAGFYMKPTGWTTERFKPHLSGLWKHREPESDSCFPL